MDTSTIVGEIAVEKSTDIPVQTKHERKRLKKRAGTVYDASTKGPLNIHNPDKARSWSGDPKEKKKAKKLKKIHTEKKWYRKGLLHGKDPNTGRPMKQRLKGFGDKGLYESPAKPGEESEY